MCGFPLRAGAAPGGAGPQPGPPGALSGDQRADALAVAGLAARWVLAAQAGAPRGAMARELWAGADFHFLVHNAAGIVSVQEEVSVSQALIRLRAYAFSHERPLADVTRDVVAHRLRLG